MLQILGSIASDEIIELAGQRTMSAKIQRSQGSRTNEAKCRWITVIL